MSAKAVAVLVAILVIGGLAWTNPSGEAYKQFQEQNLRQAIERMVSSRPGKQPAILNQLITSKNSVFLQSLIHSQTKHQNLGLFGLFETNIFSAEIVVLGIGGRFIPITNIEEALQDVEQSVLSSRQ